jgi:hypothetical protein
MLAPTPSSISSTSAASTLATPATPKVNGGILPRYVNQRVSVVGEVLNLNNGMILLESSDHQQLRIMSQSPLLYTTLTPG